MASTILKRTSFSSSSGLRIGGVSLRYFATEVEAGTDIIASTAHNVSLQKARSWDEGVSSNFSTTPLKDIFKDKRVVIFGLPGAYTGVCSQQHVPSYKNNIDKFRAEKVDSVICVAVNDPYVMNAWAEKLQAKDAIEFYGDFDGRFHKSLGLEKDLSAALLGPRSQRWSAFVVDGKVKVLNVEENPSDFKVSGAEVPIIGSLAMSNCNNSSTQHLARAYYFDSGVTFGDGYAKVLAATQTPGEAGKKWFQGTADATVILAF